VLAVVIFRASRAALSALYVHWLEEQNPRVEGAAEIDEDVLTLRNVDGR
jgi:hypothetical protein